MRPLRGSALRVHGHRPVVALCEKKRPNGGWRLAVSDRTEKGMKRFAARPRLFAPAWISKNRAPTARRSAPSVSGALNVDLLRNRQRVVDFDPEISGRALDLAMPQEKLNSTEIAGSPIDQSRFGSAK